jgi:choline dehydrogenase-like flavoprotein
LSEVLIIGSGAGGATLAKELSQRGKKVTVLESGGYPKMGSEWKALNLYTGNLLGPGEFSTSGVEILRTVMVGGSSMATIGNGVRSLQKEFLSAGIDLEDKYTEAEKELNIVPCPEENMGERTKRLLQASNELGYEMKPMPKFIDFSKCIGCGNCHLGCIYGAKWTSRNYLGEAYRNNATLKTEHEVIEILHHGDEVKGVKVRNRDGVHEIESTCVVLSAGGIGTPIIMQNSGLQAGSHFFADTLITTYGIVKDASFKSELGMATIIDEFHESEGYILSPFMEGSLDILTHRIPFRKRLNAFNLNKIIGIMAKTRDIPNGRVHAEGKIEKPITDVDQKKIDKGYERSVKILVEAGAEPNTIFKTHIRGAHPGGTAGIGRIIDKNLETEIEGLYVCDCSAFPVAPGKPPVLPIIALSKYLAETLSE